MKTKIDPRFAPDKNKSIFSKNSDLGNWISSRVIRSITMDLKFRIIVAPWSSGLQSKWVQVRSPLFPNVLSLVAG